jgi:hypothetical protein
LLLHRLISQDAPPSNDYATASCAILLPDEEMDRTHYVELHDLTRNCPLGRYEIPVPEIVQAKRYTEIPVVVPTSTLQLGFDFLPSLHRSLLPDSPVFLNIDCFLYQEGRYEIWQWAKGREGSVRRRVFTVESVN